MENNEKSFEELIEELNQIVNDLENRDIDLDKAVKEYTKGVEISKTCYNILNENKKLVTQIMTDEGIKEFNED